jgi:hypothetical protein
MVRHVARIGETRNAYQILVGKPEGKIALRDVNETRCGLVSTGLRQGPTSGFC